MADAKFDAKSDPKTYDKPAPVEVEPKDEPPPTPEEILAGIASDLSHSNYPEMREHIHALHDLVRQIVSYLQIPVETPPATTTKGK